MHRKQLINKPLSAISAGLIKVAVGELEQRTGSTSSSGKVWQHNPVNKRVAERLNRKGSTPSSGQLWHQNPINRQRTGSTSSSGKVWQHNPVNKRVAERLKRAKDIASPVAAN